MFINRFTPLNFDNPINQGLVGYYPLNERSGPVAFDMSRNNYHGDLINNPTHVQSGRFGDVLDLNPTSNQYINCGTGISGTLGNNVTSLSVSFWFKAAVIVDGLFYIGDLSGSNGELYIRLNNSTILFRMSNNTFSKSTPFTDTTDWHHIFVQYTGSKGILYLDGVEKINSSHTTNLNIDGLKIIIGAFLNSTKTFNGKIAQVRIYNRVLQPAEIKTLFMSRS